MNVVSKIRVWVTQFHNNSGAYEKVDTCLYNLKFQRQMMRLLLHTAESTI